MSTDKKNQGFQTINPTTEKSIKHYDFMTEEQAFSAVKSCHEAFLNWKIKPLEERAKIIKAIDEELFGPVASLIKANDNEDTMRIANDSRFGLGGGIFSKDEDKAIALAKIHFDTGMININSYGLAHPNMPFGGVKDSGYGREHGGFGIREFVNTKSILLN